METEWVKPQDGTIPAEKIKQAGDVIKRGGLVAFPTETVYGLGGDGLNPASSKKIYAAKGRPSDNPLIIHVTGREALPYIVKEIPESAEELIAHFWPGPLTIILKKNDRVPYETTGGLDTVAVRCPSDPVARAFIDAAGGYVAAPSANTSGRPSPTEAKWVYEDMKGRIEMLLDGGSSEIGLESTIVDLTEEPPVILRPGYYTAEDLSEVLGRVDTDRTILSADSGVAPKAPGMKYRHYAPKGDLTIVSGETEAVVSYINEETKRLGAQGKRIGVIATAETIARYEADIKKNVGDRNDPASVARTLYRVLREFDDEEADIIFSEAFSSAGLGQAVMNRLLKAAGHKVTKV
ncbi:MAG: threonylcarbamoyl-AMP synthase [Lachnospiraceae bacterium]|nr:threonylcarbamoyl-AMP synthase [Lachnospiraceae bacterium]